MTHEQKDGTGSRVLSADELELMETSMIESEEPIFQVVEVLPGAHGRTYKIWADGRTEGFEGRHIILNLIPVMASYQVAIALEKEQQAPCALRAARRFLLALVSRTRSLLGIAPTGLPSMVGKR